MFADKLTVKHIGDVVFMMNWIWFILIAVSVVFGIATGRINEVSQATLNGAVNAVTLFLTLLGSICLWNGLMKIADACGITKALAKILAPITKHLFPDLSPSGPGMKAICMNMAANFLGLGNAATPFGLSAMKYMSKQAIDKNTATNSMAMFIVINTACLQLIPTTIAVIRIKYGSSSPFEILPCVWMSSIVTLICGIILARLFENTSLHTTRIKAKRPT